MLITLVLVIGMLLTGEFTWLSSDTSHVTAAPAPRLVITPEEPVTRTLALIGMGTIAAYFAVSRTLWRRRAIRPSQAEFAAGADLPVERSSRGAA